MRFRRRGGEEGPVFPLGPMIDCTFQLLIFFMCATKLVLLESQLNVALPKKVQVVEDRKLPEEVTIKIDRLNRVYIGERQYDTPESHELPQLTSKLTSLTQFFPEQTVIIDADDNCLYFKVIDVLNACAKAKVKNIAFNITYYW